MSTYLQEFNWYLPLQDLKSAVEYNEFSFWLVLPKAQSQVIIKVPGLRFPSGLRHNAGLERRSSLQTRLTLFRGPFLESPDNYISGLEICRCFTFKIEFPIVLKIIWQKYHLTKQSGLVQDLRSYSLNFDLNICLRARKVTGTFEKRAPDCDWQPYLRQSKIGAVRNKNKSMVNQLNNGGVW